MNNNIIAFVGASALMTALAVGFVIVTPVVAQVAATSSESTVASTAPVGAAATPAPSDGSSTPVIESVAASTTVQTPATSAATTTINSSQATAADTAKRASAEPPPAGFAEVHIIGTKYIDYFTDGSTTITVPGDPNIGGNLDKPNAPVPTHAGMTWVHTTGENLYDTPSGDLEVGDYAVQPDGSYIRHAPPFVSSTSTPAQLSATITDNTAASTSASTTSPASPSVSDTSTSIATAPSDSSSGTTTSSEPTTSPAI